MLSGVKPREPFPALPRRNHLWLELAALSTTRFLMHVLPVAILALYGLSVGGISWFRWILMVEASE